jgi:predicted glycogen debranching enzyme
MTTQQSPDQFTSLQAGLRTEWLETNGLGSFASSTVIGCNTRRYHGLLVADPLATAEGASAGRRVLLNKLDETLAWAGAEYQLATNVYADATHPHGYNHLIDFTRDPWPTSTFRAGNTILRKELFMPHGQQCTVVCYTLLEAPQPVQLTLNPLLAGRGFHHLTQADEANIPALDCGDGQVAIQLHDGPSRLWLWYGDGDFCPLSDEGAGYWYYQFHYPHEAERGLDATEDLYCPAQIRWQLKCGDRVAVIAACEALVEPDPDGLAATERERRRQLVEAASDDPVTRRLFLAADQFIISRRNGKSVIAGYPWFNDWGRDAMISLPGLTLATGRYADCREILRTWLHHISDGLIPNCFGDDGDAHYNTADATLWLFTVARRYYAANGDLDFFTGDVYDALTDALRAHIAGTGHDIAMDHSDALLVAGTPDTQLTWMDAKVGNWTVTPRHGKPVEINALWYNALRTVLFFADKLSDLPATHEFKPVAHKARKAFQDTFYSDELGYCHDLITPSGPDKTLRPNQLIACALPYSLLTREQVRSIVNITEARLLTDYGVRTLDPSHPAYRGRYEGDVWTRDGAYHQGTVWPWLIGPYLQAYRVAHGDSPSTRAYIRQRLQPLIEHLMRNGSIPEIFDGDEPQHPRGCIAQAWSVAQVIEGWKAAHKTSPGE